MEIIQKTIREIESLIKTGKTPPSKEERYYNGDINWYTPGDLDKGKFLDKSNRTITQEAIAENKASLIPKHTVVIGAIGDIGKLGITTTESCTNQQITGIRTNDEVYFEYFYYWLKANKPLLESRAKNAILPILNNESIRSIRIQFPKEISDQMRIAKVLSQCEELIKKRKESIALLDELLKSTFLEMFGDPVRNDKNWKFDSLSTFGKLKNGINFSSDEIGNNYKHLGVGDFKDRWKFTDFNSLKSITLNNILSEDYFLQDGDLLFVRSNGNKQLVGRCIVIYPKDQKITFSGFCIRYRIENDSITPVYLVHLFRNKSFKLKMLNYGRGANIQNISQELLNNLNIPIPPPELQNQFVAIVETVDIIKNRFKESLKEFDNLYGSISQRAFNGELDLSKVDISDMEESKKSDLELVTDIGVEEAAESIKRKAELVEIVDQRREDDSYLSKNCRLYIENSKDLRSKIYLLSKKGEINVLDFKDEIIELDKIGEQLHLEVEEYTPWQIDQHKSVERYLLLLPNNLTDDYVNLNVFSRHQFDYSSMTLDDFYGIPDDIVSEYGSTENSMMDLDFFFKKYFSKRLFSFEEVEPLYNKLVYDRGDWFKYDEIKEYIFKSLETDDALLAQSFEEIEIKDNETKKSKTIKRIMLKVYS